MRGFTHPSSTHACGAWRLRVGRAPRAAPLMSHFGDGMGSRRDTARRCTTADTKNKSVTAHSLPKRACPCVFDYFRNDHSSSDEQSSSLPPSTVRGSKAAFSLAALRGEEEAMLIVSSGSLAPRFPKADAVPQFIWGRTADVLDEAAAPANG